MEKYHNPIKDEELVFDFSKCEGTIEESILALVSVEKIFRIYKTPTAKGVVITNEKGDVVIQGDGIKVDRKIDLFLKKTFNRYDYYCSGLVDMNEINFTVVTNGTYRNNAILGEGCEDLVISNNNIYAYLPSRSVDWGTDVYAHWPLWRKNHGQGIRRLQLNTLTKTNNKKNLITGFMLLALLFIVIAVLEQILPRTSMLFTVLKKQHY